MRIRQIGNMNVIADTRAVGRRVISAEDCESWTPPRDSIKDKGNEMALRIVAFARLDIRSAPAALKYLRAMEESA